VIDAARATGDLAKIKAAEAEAKPLYDLVNSKRNE
jgi:hypothetical protein